MDNFVCSDPKISNTFDQPSAFSGVQVPMPTFQSTTKFFLALISPFTSNFAVGLSVPMPTFPC